MDWRILIAVNGEPLAARAAGVGVELARGLSAELAFVFVLDRAGDIDRDGAVSAQIAVACQRAPHLAVKEFMPIGLTSDEIIKTAREWRANVIVMGSRGRGGVVSAILGSAAQTVARYAPCPVMVVKSKSRHDSYVFPD